MAVFVQRETHEVAVVRYTFKGWWTAQEFQDALTQTADRVYSILDFRPTLWIAPELSVLFPQLLQVKPPNTAVVVILGMNSLLVRLASLGGPRIFRANSLGEALKLLSDCHHRHAVPQINDDKVADQSAIDEYSPMPVTLVTFYPNGKPAQTSLRAVQQHGKVYTLGTSNADYVQRIRHNPRVRVFDEHGRLLARAVANIQSADCYPELVRAKTYSLADTGLNLLKNVQQELFVCLEIDCTSNVLRC